MEGVVHRLFKAGGVLLKLLDLFVTILAIWISLILVHPLPEPLPKYAILVLCYALLMHAFAYYAPRQFEADRHALSALFVTIFSNILSILIMVTIYFRPVGRRVLLVQALIMLVYLLIRGKLLAEIARGLRYTFFFVDTDPRQVLDPDLLERISSHGNIVHGASLAELQASNSTVQNYVIVNGSGPKPSESTDRLVRLKLTGHPVFTLIGFWEHFFQQIPIDLIQPGFFFERSGFDRARRRLPRVIKRTVDVCLAVPLLLVFSPLMLMIGILIRLESPGPALFRQQRTGMNGQPFTMIKFRSMRQDAEANGAQWASSNDPRITRMGAVIRKLRLDELPQLFNVLAGTMSFVGPRPERPEFDSNLQRNIPFYMLRYLVKPGLTGWAQVNYGYGASEADAREKLRYDLYYVKHSTFLMDMDILVRTARTVFLAKGR